MSALTLVAKLKRIEHSDIIAREVAMVYSKASFQPRRIDHHLGIVNMVADSLSRLSDTTSGSAVPELLAHLQPTPVRLRSEPFYSTLSTS